MNGFSSNSFQTGTELFYITHFCKDICNLRVSMVGVMLREDFFECNIRREAGRVQKLDAIIVYSYNTRGSVVEVIPMDEHIQKCFTECSLLILSSFLSLEGIDNCVAGRVVNDYLRRKEVIFCKFQKLEEISGEIFWVNQYGLAVYPGNLKPSIYKTGLRVLPEEDICSMGDISTWSDQAKAPENGLFVSYVGHPGVYGTAPD